MLATCLALMLLRVAPAPDTVVVCPDALRPRARSLACACAATGHNCLVIGSDTVDGLRRQVRAAAASGADAYVMLVGNAPAVRPRQTVGTRRIFGQRASTHSADSLLPSQVIHRFGGEPIIAGDNWFADLDDDRLPDVAIGRLPADSVLDLRVMVSKIVAYERGPAAGDWQRRINLVAGLGGFGAFADAAIEARTSGC